MVWSGLLIYWAYQPYRIGWGNTTILKLFPRSFHQALNTPYRLAEGMSIHFSFMWLFALSGLFYVIYLTLSGQWRWLLPNRQSFRECGQVILSDLKIRKKPIPQSGKYNAAQRIIYTGVVTLGFLALLTGIAIYKPVQCRWLCSLLGGYAAARLEHFIITILFVLFFILHIIQVVRAGWNRFRAMVTGFELEEENKDI
jgi:hypothetical protein